MWLATFYFTGIVIVGSKNLVETIRDPTPVSLSMSWIETFARHPYLAIMCFPYAVYTFDLTVFELLACCYMVTTMNHTHTFKELLYDSVFSLLIIKVFPMCLFTCLIVRLCV